MAVDFPVATTIGQTFVAVGITYTWNGTGWIIQGSTGSGGGLDQATADNLYVNIPGDTMTGPLTINSPSAALSIGGHAYPSITINHSVGVGANMVQGLVGAKSRWLMMLGNDSPETGSNNGSSFVLRCYDDAGTALFGGVTMEINRVNGGTYFGGNVTSVGSFNAANNLGFYWSGTGAGITSDGGTIYSSRPLNVGGSVAVVNNSGYYWSGTPAAITSDGGAFYAAGGTFNVVAGGVTATGVIQSNDHFVSQGAYGLAVNGVDSAVAPPWQVTDGLNLAHNQGRFYYMYNPSVEILCRLNVAATTAYDFNYLGVATKPGGGTWAAPSDLRIKNVEGPYQRGLADLLAMPAPVVYTYKGNTKSPQEAEIASQVKSDPHLSTVAAKKFVGFVAQDVEPVWADMVSLNPGWIDGQPVTDLRNIDTTQLIYALVNAVKELNAEIAALKAGTR